MVDWFTVTDDSLCSFHKKALRYRVFKRRKIDFRLPSSLLRFPDSYLYYRFCRYFTIQYGYITVYFDTLSIFLSLFSYFYLVPLPVRHYVSDEIGGIRLRRFGRRGFLKEGKHIWPLP